MPTSLAALAELIGGRLGAVAADGSLSISGAATLDQAEDGEISLLDSADKAHLLARSKASAVVVPNDFAAGNLPAIHVDDVHRAFAAIVLHFRPARATRRIGVSPQSLVSPTARLGENVEIHAGATVGDHVEIGANSTIHSGVRLLAGCALGRGVTIFPNAVLYENTIVGDRTVIHAGAVIGAYGFGYKQVAGHHQRTAQLGNVEIGSDVEIGACTTIDRGTYSATVIGDGTKIDNQVMIAHNCRIGRHNLICSQVGIAGSTTTGDHVIMAGQVGVRDHVHIGDRAVLGAKAGVSSDVPEGASMLGSPAMPLKDQRVQFAMLARLPDMRDQLKQLRREMKSLLGEKEDHGGRKDKAA